MPPSARAQLTFVCPSFTAADSEGVLASLVRRAHTGPIVFERTRLLFSLFGIESADGTELPGGAVSYLADTGLRPEGYWLRADPVHLRATLRDVFLEPPGKLGLAGEEAGELARDIGRHFEDRGWRLHVARPERWYLNAPPQRLFTFSTGQVAGNNLNDYLPSGEDAGRWRATWNELQMFLHQHPVNDRRESAGRLTVNSLWFWGGGELPRKATGPWTQVWSDDPIATGLSALAGAPASPLPADPALIITESGQGDNSLVVLGDDGGNAGDQHPLLPWLPVFQTGVPMQVTLLPPGDPVLTFSICEPSWERIMGWLPSLFKS